MRGGNLAEAGSETPAKLALLRREGNLPQTNLLRVLTEEARDHLATLASPVEEGRA